MSTKVTIKKVTKENFPSLIDLIIDFAEYEHQTPPTKAAIARLQKDCFAAHPRFEAFLAYKGTTPIAFIMILTTYSSFLARPTLFIEDIYIIEEYRREGIGQQLFDYVKKLAVKRNYGRMEWIAFTWNTPAIKFYQKNNAEPAKDISFFRVPLQKE